MKFSLWFGLIGSLAFCIQSGASATPLGDLQARENMVPGVVVQTVEKGSALEAAGLQPGDLVLSWTRKPTLAESPETTSGTIDSFFDWLWLEAEQAQRGGIRLTVRRDGMIMMLDVPPGEWDIRVRPVMPPSVLSLYEEGKVLVDQKKPAEGAAVWTKLLDNGLSTADWTLRCWLHLRTGIAWEWARQWDRAHAEYRSASEEARTPVAQAFVLETIAKTYGAQQSFEEGHKSFLQAIEVWRSAYGEGLGVARLDFFLGALASQHSRLDIEELFMSKAAALEEKLAPESFDLGLALHFLANVALFKGNLDASEHLLHRTRVIWDKICPASLYTAWVEDVVANIAASRGDISKRRQALLAGLEIRERLAPESEDLANSLQNLGVLDSETGDIESAASRLEKALYIREKRGRENLPLASLISALADLAGMRGEPTRQDSYLKRALSIRQRIAPGTLAVAASLLDMSISARTRGDLALAWEYGQESLHTYQAVTPGGYGFANALNNLAGIAASRQDLEMAALYCEKTLAVVSKLAPEGTAIAAALTNLAGLEIEQGKLQAAETHLKRALAIGQRHAPKSLATASTLEVLGELAERRRVLDLSQKYHEKALRIRESVARESPDVVTSLLNLGKIVAARGDLAEASRFLFRALDLTPRVASSPLEEAKILHALGNVQRRANRPDQALQSYLRAVRDLEHQFGQLGGTQDIQAAFGIQHRIIYRDLLDLLIEQKRPEEALQVLERSRARSFLSQLERRDLTWPLDLPAGNVRERRRLQTAYDAAQAEISKLDPQKEKSRIEDLRRRLHEIRQSYGEVSAALLAANPKLANLQKPEILSLPQIKRALDPGTLAILFDVGEERVHLFAVSADAPLRQVTLPLREADLRHDIEALVSFIDKRPPSPTVSAVYEHEMTELSTHLYDSLLGPVNDLVKRSSRLLIVPDGPLHLLPWGSLLMPAPSENTRRYLIESKAYHVSLSITVYDQLRKLRPEPDQSRGGSVSFTAFGDPSFPFDPGETLSADVEPRIRSVARHGFRFEPLPASRGEVERIAMLYVGSSNTFLGAEATEESAKSLPRDTRIVHFATHATLDEQSPLDSAVVLSIPKKLEEGKDNGLLQAWEIFEKVRIDADLVVLSACESGLGKEMGGEGLIGLTRAFQYAGARSVMASLWKISDRTTAELMVRFYKHLKAGLPKDEALRAAQMELIQGPIRIKNEKGEEEVIDASAPYYWAAFQIYGDWQ